MRKIPFLFFAILFLVSCGNPASTERVKAPFVWENANTYFLLTDRFMNGDTSNDINFGRTLQAAPERGFQGGDFSGIIAKIESGYFTDLGVDVLWFSPVVEQIHGATDEGTGLTYAYHGYWTKDWTSFEPNWGTEEEFADLVEKAHAKGIRIMLDVVLNHTGPVTEQDPFWGNDWVRSGPTCSWDTYENVVSCNLVENLPDIRTENYDVPVELPAFLLEKWEKEGRLEKELSSLYEFFEVTGYPQTPKFYIIKWLVDFIKKFGVDGFRVDTAKHVEASVWAYLGLEAQKAFAEWKALHPDAVLDDNDFFMLGEVYNYNISSGQWFDNAGEQVNYFKEGGFNSLINFEFKSDAANLDYAGLFHKYDSILSGEMKGHTVLNYITSHDDGYPFDQDRTQALDGGTRLLLTPGQAQIYYGDETARNLVIEGTMGDATLRGFMNWEEIDANVRRGGHKVEEVLAHYQKLGQFRQQNPAVGAGKQTVLQEKPYVCSRSYSQDGYENTVVIGLDLPEGEKSVPVGEYFKNGTMLKDYYSGKRVKVKRGQVTINTPFKLLLLGV